MFTGLIEELGKVVAVGRESGNLVLTFGSQKLGPHISVGDSVNVNGACQTVVAAGGDRFTVNTIAESVSRTTLGGLRVGDAVNLELSLRADSRMGGHFVSGHVDTTGRIAKIERLEGSWELQVDYPSECARLVVPKGSIAVDGISLTVTQAETAWFGVAVIPHTWSMTTLQYRRQGDAVNLEFDLIGKYIVRMLDPYLDKNRSVTLDRIRQAGF